MRPILYLRMKKKCKVKTDQVIRIQDVCHLIPDQSYPALQKLAVGQATAMKGNYLVVDAAEIHQRISTAEPDLDLRHLGAVQTIVEIERRGVRFPKIVSVSLVWLLLFIGSGLTIMNFHTDVSMEEVHRRIYYLVTGVQANKPLILQIPYSLGIGLGMILFFNHIFKKKFSDEPSPMDLEIFQYQETIDQYVIDHERNKDDTYDT